MKSPAHKEKLNEGIEVGSMSNSLPQKVRKKVVMTEDIHTQVKSKYELIEYDFNPQIYSCVRQIYPSIECF